MAKRAGLAILVCAVMVLVAAVPLVAGTTLITKGDKGPNASAKTWEYMPIEYGIWKGHIVNEGLRSLVVDVYDNTTGVPQEIMHQRIRFAAYDAFPAGTVDTEPVVMAAGHIYSITGTPNGPKGTKCTVEDMFKPAMPPVAMFTPTPTYLVVAVDGTASYDPDAITPPGIVSWSWDWGDMTPDGSGATASHTYAMAGTYTITLTVTDADGLTDTEAQQVTVTEPPVQDTKPIARIVANMNWMTVSVDGSTSSDDKGITAYAWAFGDGATATGPTATHKYLTPGMYTITLTVTDTIGQTGTASTTVEAKQAPPIAAFTPSVNKRDASVDGSASSDPDGTVVEWSWNWGDASALGSGKTATHKYMSVGTFTITLTVKDNDGLTGTLSKQVTTTDSPPTASFTVSVSGLVVNVDASASSDDYGVVSWSWNWGDGTTGSGKTATHTYPATKPAPSMAPAAVNGKVPPPPILVLGQTKDQAGNVVPDCTVMITNMRTGAVNYTTSDSAYGYYEFNLNDQIGGVLPGDVIKVTATKGAMSGEISAAYDSAIGFVYLDVVLKGSTPLPYDVTITLTVADELGQTASVSKVVTVTP